MRTIVVTLNIGYVGAMREDTFEVYDDATEDEIAEQAFGVMQEMVSWDWYEKDTK